MKSSTVYRVQFVHNHEDNKPEKVSLTHLAKNFQKQVRIEDATHQTETATNTAPTIAKKDKRKNGRRNTNRYIVTTGRKTKQQGNIKKKKKKSLTDWG